MRALNDQPFTSGILWVINGLRSRKIPVSQTGESTNSSMTTIYLSCLRLSRTIFFRVKAERNIALYDEAIVILNVDMLATIPIVCVYLWRLALRMFTLSIEEGMGNDPIHRINDGFGLANQPFTFHATLY